MTITAPARVVVRVDAALALTPAGRDRLVALHATGRVDAVLLGRATAASADPSTVAAFLSSRHPDLDFVVEAGFDDDFPYNVARRAASLQALAGRAAGVLLPADEPDGAAVVHELWQSWPRTSIVGDRRTRTFVDVAQVRRVDRTGRRPVAGPLQTPVDQDDLPVVLQRFTPARPEDAANADVLLVSVHDLSAADPAATAGRPLFVETAVAALGDVLARTPAGVVVDGDPDAVLAAVSSLPPAAAGPLRRRWGLPQPSVVLEGGRPFVASTGKA